jgi:hypothetical protein
MPHIVVGRIQIGLQQETQKGKYPLLQFFTLPKIAMKLKQILGGERRESLEIYMKRDW